MGKNRRRRKGRDRRIAAILLVAALAFLILLALGGAWLYINSRKPKETAEDYLQKYISLLIEKDYASMYALLDEVAKESTSLETFTERYENIYGGIEATDISAVVTNREENNSIVLLEYQLSMNTIAGELSFPTSAIFRLDEDNEYKMSWDTQDILPGLKPGYKVRVITTDAVRGNIVDRNGNQLATEGVASSVGIVPGKLGENREENIEKMAELLEISTERIEKALRASWVKDDLFVPIRTVAKDDREIKEKLVEIPGVMVSDIKSRTYPLGEAAAHLIGYVQKVTAEDLEKRAGQGLTESSVIGKAGLESIYEERLRGTNGCAIYYIDENGEKVENLLERPVVNGENIKLTIDASLQQKLYEELKGDLGLSIAMNPKSGEVLAMVSTPSYNPLAFTVGLRTSQWNALNESIDQPMYSRIRGSWCPGSVFKPIVAGIGLTEGSIDPAEIVENEGLKWQKSSSWGDFFITTLTDYEEKNLKNALIYSDNIYFAKAADKIGKDNMEKNLVQMGFLESIPFQQSMEASSFGKEGKFTGEADVANSGYGQGNMLVNPLHLASMYSAFLNEGSMIQPTLEEGEPAYWKEQVFTKEAAANVWDYMVQVIENPEGTGREGKVEGLALAGKTGTAEIKASQDDITGTELGWFVEICNQGDNSMLIVAMVENVKGRGGSHYVIPIVKAGMEQYYGKGTREEEDIKEDSTS